MQNVTPIAIAALVLELAPAGIFGCAAERVARTVERWPLALRLCMPALLAAPYAMVSISEHIFRWEWFALYAALPVAIAWLLMHAAAADAEAARRLAGRVHPARAGPGRGFALVRPGMAERPAGLERIASGGCGLVWISRDPPTEWNRIQLPLEMERLENWPARTVFSSRPSF